MSNTNCVACKLERSKSCRCTYVPKWLFKSVTVIGSLIILSLLGLTLGWDFNIIKNIDSPVLDTIGQYQSPI